MHLVLVVFLLLTTPSAAGAHDYPTLARVDYVLSCMKKHGGQDLDNLYACSCEIDMIASLLTFEDWEEASTFERYRRMPGEQGGLFRDSTRGEKMIARLREARLKAEHGCFLRPKAAKPNKKD